MSFAAVVENEAAVTDVASVPPSRNETRFRGWGRARVIGPHGWPVS
jgi:hypothetical protein